MCSSSFYSKKHITSMKQYRFHTTISIFANNANSFATLQNINTNILTKCCGSSVIKHRLPVSSLTTFSTNPFLQIVLYVRYSVKKKKSLQLLNDSFHIKLLLFMSVKLYPHHLLSHKQSLIYRPVIKHTYSTFTVTKLPPQLDLP